MEGQGPQMIPIPTAAQDGVQSGGWPESPRGSAILGNVEGDGPWGGSHCNESGKHDDCMTLP